MRGDARTVTRFSPCLEATLRLGAAFGKTAEEYGMIALTGPLGAGKTQFVKGIAKGLAIPPDTVTSPTYLLMHRHQGRLPLIHVDLYRLDHPGTVSTLELEAYFEGEGVIAVEWAEKGGGLLPEGRLTVEITEDRDSGTGRIITMTAVGGRHQGWLARALEAVPSAEEEEQ